MRAGDRVFHRPTGERWILAFADGKDVSPCGWPACLARVADCELLELASDAEHRQMLETWAAKSQGELHDHRISACRHELAELNAREGRTA